MKNRNSKRAFSAGSALLLGLAVFSVLLVGYYILFPSRGVITSDTVDTLLWGQASADSGRIFNPDFEYAALLPFGGNLLMWPAVKLFGVTMAAQAFGMICFFLIFVAAILFFGRQMGWNMKWSCALAVLLLLVLSSSAKLREIYWEHVLYYSLGTLFFLVGFGLFARYWRESRERGKKQTFFLAALGLWCLLTGTDQMEIVTLFLLPLFGAIAAEWFFDIRGEVSAEDRKNTLKALAVILIGTGIGFLTGAVLKSGLTASYQNAYSGMSATSQWAENALKFVDHWFSLLGIQGAEQVSLFSPDGILNLLRMLAGLVLIAAPAAAAVLYPKIKDRLLKILILFHWLMTAFLMVGYIVGKLSASNWRLSPLAASSVILCVAFGRYLAMEKIGKRLACLVLVPLGLAAAISAGEILKMAPDQKMDTGLHQIARELSEMGLDYGFATFWNANGVTVVSDSQICVRGVDLTDDGLKPITYQSNIHWFEDQPGQEEYFFLLEEKEFLSLESSHPLLEEEHEEKVLSNGYVVLVYPENIVRKVLEENL